jgi:hypothetical protein
MASNAPTRADGLGLDHTGDCADDNPVGDRLRCFRCWYLARVGGNTAEGGEADADQEVADGE